MLQLWYEVEVVERNGGQTLGVLGSLMEEYDLRYVLWPLSAKIAFFEKATEGQIDQDEQNLNIF